MSLTGNGTIITNISNCENFSPSPVDATITNHNQTLLVKKQRRLRIDTFILILMIVPILVFEIYAEPFKRGFFCNDESIRYPYYPNTVSTLNLCLFVVLVPLVSMLIVEYLQQRQHSNWTQTAMTQMVKLPLLGWQVPLFVQLCFVQFMYYVFGEVLTLNATEIGKFSIGRLRPHFYSVCQPRMLDGSTCSDIQNHLRYIEHYYCTATFEYNGKKFTVSDVRQARLSFPSGHSSLIWYSMVYMIMYLQQRLVMLQHTHLTRVLLQFVCLTIAWFTGLSRIMDYHHHWSDVFVGSLIGTFGAVLSFKYMAQGFLDISQHTSSSFTQSPSRYALRELYVLGN